MSKNKQYGFTLVEGLIILLIVAVIGFVGYYVYSRNQDDSKRDTTTTKTTDSQSNETETTETADPYENWKTYESTDGQYSFKYPENWQTYSCPGNNETVYLGSDRRNIGFTGDSSTNILCGGGTDFPPQVVATVRTIDNSGNIYTTEQTGDPVTIDGKAATKSREVSDGSGLRQKGFVTVVYQVKLGNKLLTVAYNQWPPEFSDDYDTNPDNEQVLETIVTKTLDIKS